MTSFRSKRILFARLAAFLALLVVEALYIDTCCHVNEHGNELLVDDLVRAVVDGYRDLAHD